MQQGHVVKASSSQRRSLINDEKTKLSVMLGVAERWALHVDRSRAPAPIRQSYNSTSGYLINQTFRSKNFNRIQLDQHVLGYGAGYTHINSLYFKILSRSV